MVTVIDQKTVSFWSGHKRSGFCRAEAEPLFRPFEPDEPSDLEDPLAWPGDDRWDVFLPDGDQPYEELPQPGDFWIDADGDSGE